MPADCRVLSCTDLMVDESSLTGEGALVEKTSAILLFNEAQDVPIAERTNIIFMVRACMPAREPPHHPRMGRQTDARGRMTCHNRARWCATGTARRWWWARA